MIIPNLVMMWGQFLTVFIVIFPTTVPQSFITSFTTIPELYLLAASSFRHAFIIQDFLHLRLHDRLLDHVYAT